MKNLYSNTVLQLLVVAFILLLSNPAGAAIKCWKNHDGVRECGNAIPPEYAQGETEVKSKLGLTVDKQGPAKSIDELKAEQAAEREAEMLAKEQEKRDAQDRVLLDTFASEDDLVLTRDGQIAHLDSQIRLTRGHISKLETNLDQMIYRAAEVERRGDKPSEDMIANIANVRGQIAENEAFITTKREEQEAIRARFEKDIKRFRDLKAAGR